MRGLLGKKIGMTRIFDDSGNMVPVTVLEVGPCVVTQMKNSAVDGMMLFKLDTWIKNLNIYLKH